MSKSITPFVKLEVECLEDKILPSGNLLWPITLPGNPVLSLMNTYGQYVSTTAGIVLHSGIDILVPNILQTPVRPIQFGNGETVFGVGLPPFFNAPSRLISVRGATNGFNYLHTVPGLNPNFQRWIPGDVVGIIPANRPFGAVELGGNQFPRHLHLDYTDIIADPRFVIGGVPTILRPMNDPLAFLTPLNDLVAPFVSNDIHFRIAQDDTQQLNQILPQTPQNVGQALEGIITSHKYFQEVAGGRLLIGAKARMVAAGLNARSAVSNIADIDIIASMFDQTAAGGRLLNVRRNWFRIAGESFGKDTGWISSFMFAGEFLGAGQTMNQFNSSDLTRVVYEHDRQSFSNGPVLPGPGNQTAFWYIMTNTDGNNIVELADRGRFWNSNVSIGNAWNAGNGADAISNATSEFPDDFYTISVSAEDEALNVSLPKNLKVLLVNWERTLQTSADSYDIGNTIRVNGGTGYRANQDVALHLVPAGATAAAPPTTTVLNN